MRYLFVFAVVFVVAEGASLQEQWQEFKLNHGKTYKSLLEEKKRFTIFKENVRTIEEHNQKFMNGELSYSYGINQFSDLTAEEFASSLSKITPNPAGIRKVYNESYVGEKSINWVTKGLVTPVKSQGRCGSCWAFSAVGSIEGQIAKAGGDLESLSAQNLVDCDSFNRGCDGGRMNNAFDYIRYHGVPTEREYPYIGVRQRCRTQGGIKISDYIRVAPNEIALMSALCKVGPISVGVDADHLQHYSKGIFDTDSRCTDSVNHGVLLVGAGNENGKDYWLIKNSWGANWGEAGYFRLVRGKAACGIVTFTSYPVL